MVKRKLETIIPILLFTLSCFGIFVLQRQYTRKYIENITVEKDYFIEEEKIKTSLALQKKIPTLGFNNLLADWQYLQFIQYFGDTPARETTGYSAVTDYFELISNYDPRFINAYFILSTANSIYAAQPEKTVSFLNQVLENLSPEINPNAFSLWIYKGVDEILFLGDIPAAQNSYEMASKWALARNDEVGKTVALQTSQTAKFLADNPDSKKAQVSAWKTIFDTAFDEKTKQMAINKIKSLGGDVNISPDGKVKITLPEQD